MDKIICVGKNYLEHAQEMGDPHSDEPVIFFKPPSALVELPVKGRSQIKLPWHLGDIHFECEIVLKIRQDLPPDTFDKFDALQPLESVFSHVTLGLDLTLRELQSRFKKLAQPWELAKVFTNSAIVAEGAPLAKAQNFMNEPFEFFIEGQVRQKGQGSQMRFRPLEILSFLSSRIPLCPGDLLFTGTPKGVGPLAPGQKAELRLGQRIIAQIEFE